MEFHSTSIDLFFKISFDKFKDFSSKRRLTHFNFFLKFCLLVCSEQNSFNNGDFKMIEISSVMAKKSSNRVSKYL